MQYSDSVLPRKPPRKAAKTPSRTPRPMRRPSGYHGRCLNIDLSSGHGEPVELSAEVLRRFLGGAGLGTHLLLEHGAASHDALSPAAAVAIVFSSLVGSPLTTSAKFAVVSKSPLTER